MNELRSRMLAALAVLGFTASAFAQTAPANRTFSTYYFFGDSLTDSGNTFALTGSPGAPYYQGRVSNGITYAEYLAPGLAAAATTSSNGARLNFAFAGATATVGSAVPNLQTQVAMYQARGIAAKADGLYVVLAGANDLLNTVSVPATQNGPALTNAGVAASSAVATAVKSLATLGAKNVLVLSLPDISKTPRFTTGSGAPAAALIQVGSYAFNNDIKGRLLASGIGADVNLTVFDLNSVLATVLANPQRFGFSITNQDYVDILLAGGSPGDAGQYVFWDGIHPTTKMHAVFATVLTEVLNPEFVLGTFAAHGTAALAATDMTADALAGRLDTTRAAVGRHSADGWISYGYKTGAYNRDSYRNDFDFSGSVVTAGFDLNLTPELLVGAAVSAENLKTDLKAGAGSGQMRGQLVAVYAQWKSGAFFSDANAAYGSQDFKDLKRTTALGGFQTSGETDGDRVAAAVRVGADFSSGALRFTPFAGLRYAKAKLDGYTETGVTGLNFVFDGQTAKSFEGLLGATADWTIDNHTLPLVLSASAVYQKDMADDTRSFSGRLADTIAATSTINVADGLGETFKVGLRASGLVSKRWGWSLGYLADFRKDGNTANQYMFALQTGF
ncbi:MAG: autotransporter domain-containing protein [Opitutae bacterium]|nr:autotransporter domain-containing protein [Opitutae bacterium]